MSATPQSESPAKISIRIWLPLLDRFNNLLQEACLRRDPYLAKLLETEVTALDREVCLANSLDSQQHVAEALESLGELKLVTLTLPRDLVVRLNEVCARKRIVRDAFFNRLFLLLTATTRQLDALLFGGSAEWRQQAWESFKQDPSVFFDMFQPTLEPMKPFWAIRDVFEEDAGKAELEKLASTEFGEIWVQRDGLTDEITPPSAVYTVVFPPAGKRSLLGLSTHLPDSRIPDHPAEKKARETIDEILSRLDLGAST